MLNLDKTVSNMRIAIESESKETKRRVYILTHIIYCITHTLKQAYLNVLLKWIILNVN